MGALSAPEPLGPHHKLDGFGCGEPSLDDWLRRRALANATSGASRTFVVRQDGEVRAYYALAVGAVEQSAAAGKFKRNMPDPIPVIVIGRLAVDRRLHGQGVARGLVKDAIVRAMQVAEQVGVRGILVHAISDAARSFWAALGFTSSPLAERTMMITLADAIAALGQR